MTEGLTFDVIYAEYATYVRRVLQRLGVQPRDLDDLVQDTFVAVHRQLHGFEGRAALELSELTGLAPGDRPVAHQLARAGARMLAGMMLRAADETPGGVAFLAVVEPTPGPPDGPARAVMRSLARRVNTRLRVAAFMTRSQGLFRLIPPIINATVFLSGARFKIRFFADEQAAFEYVGRHAAVTPAPLRAQNEHMRRQVDAAELHAIACTLGRGPGP